jgi:modulator of FtsH protease HflK
LNFPAKIRFGGKNPSTESPVPLQRRPSVAKQTVEIPIEDLRQGIFSFLPLAVILLTIVTCAWDSAFTVALHEKAVIFRLGKPTETVGPGLHWKAPFVDKVVIVDSIENEWKLPFSVSPEGNLRSMENEEESVMLTADLNAAIVEWTIQWKVIEPEKFLLSLHPEAVAPVIRSAARATMQQMIGDYSIDEVLTSKRTEVGNKAREALQESLKSFDSGIAITGLQMQRVTPPSMVKPAFDEVNASVQKRDQLINEANRERNILIPKAEAEKDRLIRDAEGYAARRKAETEGEINALIEQYKAYKEAPEITRQRLYLETLQEILQASGPKTIVDSDLRGLVPFLDLNGTGTRALSSDPGSP